MKVTVGAGGIATATQTTVLSGNVLYIFRFKSDGTVTGTAIPRTWHKTW